MAKHGRQFFEGPDEVLVCVVDDSRKAQRSWRRRTAQWFIQSELEKSFRKSLRMDVAPGYSEPAFATHGSSCVGLLACPRGHFLFG